MNRIVMGMAITLVSFSTALAVEGDERIGELRAEVQDQIGYLRTFMLWGFGILLGGIGGLITVVIWDRRTARRMASCS